MRRISDRTVELSEAESLTVDAFNDYLKRGNPIPVAAKFALTAMLSGTINEAPEWPSDAFIAWLSEGRVVRWGKGFAYTKQARSEMAS